jgi:hypothetical protein
MRVEATRPGTIEGLLHRGGLNVDILSGGMISVRDEVALLLRAGRTVRKDLMPQVGEVAPRSSPEE